MSSPLHVNITGDDTQALTALTDTESGVKSLIGTTVTIEGDSMFERFTDRARRVVVLSQEEARSLNHNYIGTEHLLLGLIHEGEGVAAKVLKELNVALEDVRSVVEEIIGTGQTTAVTGHIPYTPRAKKVLELSLREALQLGHNYIGTEHLLMGLIREGEGVGAQALVKLGAELNTVRKEVLKMLGDRAPSPTAQLGKLGISAPAPITLPPHSGHVCPKCPGTDVSTEYAAQVGCHPTTNQVHSFYEHLHRECRTCGYSWNEACK